MLIRKCVPCLMLLFAALPVATAAAQVIRGRVFHSDSATALAGIVVSAVGPNSTTAGRGLTTRTGDFLIRVGRGTYELRALRIGYQPSVVAGVMVSDGDTVVRNIVLTSLPVALTVLDVRGDDEVSLRGRDGQRVLQLWEQARGALAAIHLREQSGALDVRIMHVRGRQDGPGSYSDPPYIEVDTLTVREESSERAAASTPPETLMVRGYVRTGQDGQAIYDMPNAEVLLSDAFIDGHCFALRKSDEREDWIGVAFRPRRTAQDVVGIRGVLWMDRASAELRRVEFEYANLPDAEYRVCDLQPHIPLTPARLAEVPQFKQPQPGCQTQPNRNNRLKLGGSADFARLPTGEWLVAEWTLRMPPDQGRYRALPFKSRWVNRRSERCHFGPGCVTMIVMRPRLVTTTGVVMSVRRGGELLYENDAAAGLLSAAVRMQGRPPD